MGFTGKQAIHPDQIPIIQETFAPSKTNLEYSARLMMQYAKEFSEGKRGAWEFEGKMIDKPVIRKAKETVRLAHVYEIDPETTSRVVTTLEEIGETLETDVPETTSEVEETEQVGEMKNDE